jgi:hypothetical protein
MRDTDNCRRITKHELNFTLIKGSVNISVFLSFGIIFSETLHAFFHEYCCSNRNMNVYNFLSVHTSSELLCNNIQPVSKTRWNKGTTNKKYGVE